MEGLRTELLEDVRTYANMWAYCRREGSREGMAVWRAQMVIAAAKFKVAMRTADYGRGWSWAWSQLLD